VGCANDKQWVGKATEALGLEDGQFKEQLKQILNGKIDALNIKVGNKKHIPGYDLTFSPLRVFLSSQKWLVTPEYEMLIFRQ